MPRLSQEKQAERREAILAAAERCFARHGFHRTTMQDICKEAGVSPGALYLYFASKEEMIEGLCARERQAMTQVFEDSQAGREGDLAGTLKQIVRRLILEEPDHKRALFFEIGAEALRNPTVARIVAETDLFMRAVLETVIAQAAARGEIVPRHDAATTVQALATVADGLYWRTALSPEYGQSSAFEAALDLFDELLGVGGAGETASGPSGRSDRGAAARSSSSLSAAE